MPDNAAENVIEALFGSEPAPEPDPNAEIARFAPANSDLVDLTAEQVRRCQDKGIDPTISSVAVGRVVGNKVAHLGTFGAAGSTIGALSAQYGAGLYQVTYRNPSGAYVGARRIHVQADGSAGPPPPLTATVQPYIGAAYQRPQGPSPLEALAYKLVEQKLTGPSEDPMRATLAEVLKLYALSAEQQRQAAAAAAESQRQFLQTMMQIQQLGGSAPKTDPASDRMFDLLSKLAFSERSKPAPPQPVDQFMKALEFGMKIATTAGAPASPAEPKDPSWLELVIPAVDSIGPPLVSTIAEAVLDKEKAAAVQATMQAHMKARQAEAQADATGPIDTDGAEVPA